MHSFDFVPRAREWWRGRLPEIPLGGGALLVALSPDEIAEILEALGARCNGMSPDAYLEDRGPLTLAIRFETLDTRGREATPAQRRRSACGLLALGAAAAAALVALAFVAL